MTVGLGLMDVQVGNHTMAVKLIKAIATIC